MTNDTQPHALRWEGRNQSKDVLRREIWNLLEETGSSVGSVWSHIPNFVGADQAADRLAQLPIWQQAKIVKSNPDSPQIPVRLRALQEGKLLYMPIPELKDDYPFVLLDPAELTKQGIAFEDVAERKGAVKLGRKVRFDEMLPIDLVVTGCVAVTRQGARTGKGGGFADLELGLFRELGLIKPETPISTTVHAIQVVDNDRLTMLPHDSPLNWIITPDEVIETHTPYPTPTGVYWAAVEPDQYRDIPFLAGLKESLTKNRE
jgi:5-formyltetrahydrofolate cyclo-ligase